MRANSSSDMMVPNVHLFHSRKKCRKFLKRNGWKKVKFYGTGAQMMYSDGMAVILMEHEGDPIGEASLLVHECYHAAYHHMDWMGEDDYGEESMAYLIQTIAHGVLSAHGAWKAKHGMVE